MFSWTGCRGVNPPALSAVTFFHRPIPNPRVLTLPFPKHVPISDDGEFSIFYTLQNQRSGSRPRFGTKPAGKDPGEALTQDDHTTALFAVECQSFLRSFLLL